MTDELAPMEPIYDANRKVEVTLESLFALYVHALGFHKVMHGEDVDGVLEGLTHVDITADSLQQAFDEIEDSIEFATKYRPHDCEAKLTPPPVSMDTDIAVMLQSLLAHRGAVTSDSIEVVEGAGALSAENMRRLDAKVAELEAAAERGEEIPDVIYVEGENGEDLVLMRTD